MNKRQPDPDFVRMANGYCLTTAEVLYYLPDHPSILQSFLWQTYDVHPEFPRIHRFMNFWRREIDAVVHSVRIAHEHMIRPTVIPVVNGVLLLN